MLVYKVNLSVGAGCHFNRVFGFIGTICRFNKVFVLGGVSSRDGPLEAQ